MKQTIKILGIYFFGILCLGLYYGMKNSKDLAELLEKAERRRIDTSFTVFATVGLIEMALLVIGTSSIVIISLLLIRKRFQKY